MKKILTLLFICVILNILPSYGQYKITPSSDPLKACDGFTLTITDDNGVPVNINTLVQIDWTGRTSGGGQISRSITNSNSYVVQNVNAIYYADVKQKPTNNWYRTSNISVNFVPSLVPAIAGPSFIMAGQSQVFTGKVTGASNGAFTGSWLINNVVVQNFSGNADNTIPPLVTNTLADGSVISAQIANPCFPVSNSITVRTITGPWQLSNTNLFTNYGFNVGIGTSTPVSKLEVAGGVMKSYYNPGQISKTQLDDINGSLGNSGIVENNAGDLHLRGFWGVVIDKNGGNLGESASYSNGVNPAGGSFAVRTRIGTASFTTDFIVRNNGYVGIGTASPTEKLEVIGNIKISSGNEIFFADNGQIRSFDNYHRILFRRSEAKMELREYGDIIFSPGATSASETAKVVFKSNGSVVISGRVDAQEYHACLTPGICPDYVFESHYKLMPLNKVEDYIKTNKHLPEVPSALEMESNGMDMKAMNLLLLKKVEELTLHLIAIQKKEGRLSITNQRLENRLAKLEKTLKK